MFITAKERGREVAIPRSELAESAPDYAYLGGRGMGELLDAELAGTIGALRARKRPTATLTLARPTAGALGELIMLLEATTAFCGPLYGVDPYNQPGVEDAKRRAYAALGRPGFEAVAKEIAAAPGPDPRWML
jgi:glucose-6-phosphate isomerase